MCPQEFLNSQIVLFQNYVVKYVGLLGCTGLWSVEETMFIIHKGKQCSSVQFR